MSYQKQKNLIKKCIINGKYEYASTLLEQLKEISPHETNLLKDIGMFYIAMGQYKKALVNIKEAFNNEKSYEFLELLAHVNEQCENYEDSVIQYETLLEYKKNDDIYNKCINLYLKLEYEEEAIRIAKKFVVDRNTPAAYARLIYIYILTGMDKEALSFYDEMNLKFPNNSITFNTSGLINECIYNNYEEAKKYYEKSARMGFLDAYYNLGSCCKQSEDFENAEKYLKKLISVNSKSSTDYNYTLGSVYMAERKLRLGYKYYKKRLSAQNLKEYYRKHLWDGKDYPKGILYIATEQGYGDNIQFVRYIPKLLSKFKKVYLETREPLIELFKRSFPKETYPNLEIVPKEEIVRFSHYALIMDIPNLLHETFHNIPSKNSYLACSERSVEMFKKNLFNSDDLKIGLNWKAKGEGLRDAVYRTIDAPYYFRNIMNFSDVKYYSFQMNDIFGMCEKYSQIKDLAPMLKTFHDTASALKNLDILVTVDTALAHLAGALGVKTYLLLCHAPDWRWFDNTEKTEWYPSITIIKQKDRKSWDDVAQKLEKHLLQDIKSRLKKK